MTSNFKNKSKPNLEGQAYPSGDLQLLGRARKRHPRPRNWDELGVERATRVQDYDDEDMSEHFQFMSLEPHSSRTSQLRLSPRI